MTELNFIYYANHGNSESDDSEGHIVYSLLKLGHRVNRVHQSASEVPNGDVLLFHKGGKYIQTILRNFKGKKICWFWDKVWHSRQDYIFQILPYTDKIFFSDKAWVDKNPHKKFKILRQGIGEKDAKKGLVKEEYKCDIAFTGSIYGEREKWIRQLTKYEFKHFNSVYNRDFYDLCASAKILIAPPYPSDDDYWSSRVYITLGSGGFLLHPYCRGLEQEYGDSLVFYKNTEDMHEKIEFYLKNEREREKIRIKGFLKTVNEFTYTKRVEELCKTL